MTRDELIALAKQLTTESQVFVPYRTTVDLAHAFLEADAERERVAIHAAEYLDSVKELNDDVIRLEAERDAARAEVVALKATVEVLRDGSWATAENEIASLKAELSALRDEITAGIVVTGDATAEFGSWHMPGERRATDTHRARLVRIEKL